MIENTNVDLLSERALYALAYAEEEARLLGNSYIGGGHLLLGLMRDDASVAGRTLRALDLTLDATREEVTRALARTEQVPRAEPALAPGALSAIAYAQYEAESAGEPYVGTHHLLLGLTRDAPDIPMTVLQDCGVTEAELRQRVAATLELPDLPPDDLAPVLRKPMLGQRARELLRPSGEKGFHVMAPLTPPAPSPVPAAPPPPAPLTPATPEMSRGLVGDHFDQFTERARLALSLAQEEARRFNHNYIGTEHLLLGLVREGDGVAAKVLSNLGVELNKVRNAVEFIIGRGDRIVLGDIGLTPRSKKVVELAVDEARRLNHHYIGTEHLLLGLVREGEGIAAGVLESLGVNLQRARTQTLQVLSQSGAPNPNEPGDTWPRPASAAEFASHSATAAGAPESEPESESAVTGAAESESLAGPRFDRFSERSRTVLVLAREEAQAFGHHYVGTEHLLLGLIREGAGVAAMVLSSQGVTLGAARALVEELVGRGEQPVQSDIGLTPRARHAIARAAEEAQRQGVHYIGTEHLLLGLLRDGSGGTAGWMLQRLGVNLDAFSVRVLSQTQGPGVTLPGPEAAPEPTGADPDVAGVAEPETSEVGDVLPTADTPDGPVGPGASPEPPEVDGPITPDPEPPAE